MAEQVHDGPCWCPKAPAESAEGEACQCCGAESGEPCRHLLPEAEPREVTLNITTSEALALGYAMAAGRDHARAEGDIGVVRSLRTLSEKFHKANER